MSWLFIKALFAFLVLPGTIGFFIPLWLIDPREFYVAGRGTLAPWPPPPRWPSTRAS